MGDAGGLQAEGAPTRASGHACVCWRSCPRIDQLSTAVGVDFTQVQALRNMACAHIIKFWMKDGSSKIQLLRIKAKGLYHNPTNQIIFRALVNRTAIGVWFVPLMRALIRPSTQTYVIILNRCGLRCEK